MSYHHLTPKERGIIARLWNNKISCRQIALRLGRSPSTIAREVSRNASGTKYLSAPAQAQYMERRMVCRRKRLYQSAMLANYITEKLMLTWSPEQIANRIKLDWPHEPAMRISCSSIYRWLRHDLLPQAAQLRINLRHYGHRHGEKRGQYHGIRELQERSREALRRKRLGDWEVDTIVSTSRHGGLLNATDRKSRYCFLVILKKVTGNETMRGFEVFFGQNGVPLESITADRGKEFCLYKEFEARFGVPFYFTRPSSPWQKPTVENTNGLIRQFFPKGTEFNEISSEAVAHAMELLNNRPRKCLDWKTPAEVLFA